MASLDVESFFTNIELNETINNCISDLHNKNIYNLKFSERDLFKLPKTATKKSSFIFDYLLYEQVDGVEMGSYLDPSLANVFLCHYEKEWLDNCPIHFKPMIYKSMLIILLCFFSSKDYL